MALSSEVLGSKSLSNLVLPRLGLFPLSFSSLLSFDEVTAHSGRYVPKRLGFLINNGGRARDADGDFDPIPLSRSVFAACRRTKWIWVGCLPTCGLWIKEIETSLR